MMVSRFALKSVSTSWAVNWYSWVRLGATAKGDAAFFHEGEQPFGVFRQGGYRVNQVRA